MPVSPVSENPPAPPKPKRSPTSETIFQYHRAELSEGKELYDEGLYTTVQHEDHVAKSMLRYNDARNDRKRDLLASSSAATDAKDTPEEATRHRRSPSVDTTPSSVGGKSTSRKRKDSSASPANSCSAARTTVQWTENAAIPRKLSWDQQVDTFQLVVEQSESLLWFQASPTAEQVPQKLPNTISEDRSKYTAGAPAFQFPWCVMLPP